MDLISTIHPQEIDRAGIAAVITASNGDMLENFKGPKNMMKVTVSIRNSTIRSYIVDGGVKNIFAISILTFIFTPAFQPFLPRSQ
jgi:hypothetical protein